VTNTAVIIVISIEVVLYAVQSDPVQGEKANEPSPKLQDTKGNKQERIRTGQVGSPADVETTAAAKAGTIDTGKGKPGRKPGHGTKSKARRAAPEVRPTEHRTTQEL
jgi:hypothetical protein